ncbi:MAG TPA: lysophospholipid acyltransferase family protein [Candidatus Omnitrophota bacterium]|nr:lysophospholipid acyltransferase family protein [Candidatus Omnitrophota bacterium]
MKKTEKYAITIFVWIYVSLLTVLTNFTILLSFLPFSIFDPQRRIAHTIITLLWGKVLGKFNPFWKLRLKPSSSTDPKQTYVIVCNHTSLADIICIYNLNLQFKWIAKESLFKVPFLGWCMSLAKYIPLERGKTSSIRTSYEKSKWWLNQGMSVLIFPEGTRSKDGSLGDFKNGAFKLAIECQRPILPVVLKGNEKVIAKGKSTVAGRTETLIKVLPPVETRGFGLGDFQALKKKIHDLYKSEVSFR